MFEVYEFLRDFNCKSVLDSFEKKLHLFLYKKTLATMQIKEVGFNYMTFKNGMDPLQEK